MAHRRHLPDLPALVRRQLRRRHRRPAGRHRAPRRPRRARRRRDLAQPVPALAAEGRRLRRRRLLRRRPALRHAGRLRRDARRGACAAASASSSTSCRTTRPTSTSGSRRRWPRRPGSRERARYLFRDGKGANGELPPNNWESVFGGPAWTRVIEADGTPGQWYLHLFDSSQPDFDWSNEEVREEFRRILRFWLDRGVDGFRVDVAHGLIKAGRPSRLHAAGRCRLDGRRRGRTSRTGASDGVHEIYRDWHGVARRVRRRPRAVRRGVAARRPSRPRCGCVPTRCTRRSTSPTSRPSGMPRALRAVIDESLRGLRRGRRAEHVGALEPRRRAPRVAARADRREPAGPRHRPALARQADPRRSACAAPAPRRRVMLALPGSAYLYQGEELGLPEVDRPARRGAPGPDLVPHRRRALRPRRLPRADPVDRRRAPAYGFSPTGAAWLPQPASSGRRSPATRRSADPASTLSLYRTLLAARRAHDLGAGTLEWLDGSRRGRRRIPQRECDGRREHRRRSRSRCRTVS